MSFLRLVASDPWLSQPEQHTLCLAEPPMGWEFPKKSKAPIHRQNNRALVTRTTKKRTPISKKKLLERVRRSSRWLGLVMVACPHTAKACSLPSLKSACGTR